MPETIRTANERLRSRARRGGFLAAFVFATLCSALSTPAHAGVGAAFSLVEDMIRAGAVDGRQQLATLTLTLVLICFAVLATIVLLRTRKAAATNESSAHDEAMALRAEIDRLKTLLLSQPQVLVAWAAGSDEAEIFGDTTIVVVGFGAGTRARLRRLAGAGGRATHAARGRRVAQRRPRLRDDAHHQVPAVRSRRKDARSPGARCSACATSAASKAS